MADTYADAPPQGAMVNTGAAPTPEDFAKETADRGNIIDLLDDDQIVKAQEAVKAGWQIDCASNQGWEDEVKKALSLISRLDGDGPGQGTKSYPFEGASAVVWPIIQEAAIQWHARTFPALLQGSDVVKVKTHGADPDGRKEKRGRRVARHISYQLVEGSNDWEEDKDTQFLQLPIIGQSFSKVFWDPESGQPDASLVSALNLKVARTTRSLRSCPRITEERSIYPYEIEERMASGRYRRVPLSLGDDEARQKPQRELECHIRIDLDGDGYPEPWIVTATEEGKALAIAAGWGTTERDIIRKQTEIEIPTGVDPATGELMMERRVVPGDLLRIVPQRHYVGYKFMPDPSGGFYGIGFARLLAHPQAAVSATINQIIDAAKIQNAGGGMIGRGASFGGKGASGEIRMNPTKWTSIPQSGDDIRKNVIPWADIHRGPSTAAFATLDLLLGMAKSSAAFMNDALTGDIPSQVQPMTLQMLIEQGMQVFKATHKRAFKSLGQEYVLVADLNRRFPDQASYATLLDDPEADAVRDYDVEDKDITPVADPSQVTAVQRLSRAQFLMQFYGQPDSNNAEIKKFSLEAAGFEQPERFIKEPEGPPPELLMQARMDIAKTFSEAVEKFTKAIENVAKAEAAEAGANVAEYGMIVQAAAAVMTGLGAQPQGAGNGQQAAPAGPAGMGGLVGSPGGGGVPGLPAPPTAGPAGGMARTGQPSRPGAPGVGANAGSSAGAE